MRSAKDTEASDRARGFLARATSRAALPYLAVGLLLIVAIVAGGREIEHHISAIESWITKLGPWGVVAFVGLFVLSTSFLLPDTVLCIIAGALFGLGWGFAAALAGSVCWPGQFSSRSRTSSCGDGSSGRLRRNRLWLLSSALYAKRDLVRLISSPLT